MKTFDIESIQLKIQAPHITVSDELNNLIIRLIEKLGKTYGRIKRCEMMLRTLPDAKNKNCEVEVKLFIPGDVLFAINKQDNFQLATREVFDDLHEQLYKFKEKITN